MVVLDLLSFRSRNTQRPNRSPVNSALTSKLPQLHTAPLLSDRLLSADHHSVSHSLSPQSPDSSCSSSDPPMTTSRILLFISETCDSEQVFLIRGLPFWLTFPFLIDSNRIVKGLYQILHHHPNSHSCGFCFDS